jgi:hypothetical protein
MVFDSKHHCHTNVDVSCEYSRIDVIVVWRHVTSEKTIALSRDTELKKNTRNRTNMFRL